MTYFAAGATGLGLAVGAVSQHKAQKDARAMQEQAIRAAGSRPEIAAYEPVELNPVNFQQIQRETLDGNYNMVGLIEQLMRANSGINRATSLDRANAFSPALWGNVGTTAGVANDYLNGKASWSDSTETVARSTGLTGSTGTPGTGAALTARDLGLLDMDLRTRGAQLNGQAIQQGEALDPRGNYGTPQDWELTPRETVPWKVDENLKLSNLAMQQAEDVYTAEQNGFNLAAGIDPAATAGLAYQERANQGVNWNQIISGLGETYTNYRTNTGLNTGGTYATSRKAQAAAPYAAGTSGNVWKGYTPKAQVVT